jgi:hypothetical protein
MGSNAIIIGFHEKMSEDFYKYTLLTGTSTITGWWFQTCFIFQNIWDNLPH